MSEQLLNGNNQEQLDLISKLELKRQDFENKKNWIDEKSLTIASSISKWTNYQAEPEQKSIAAISQVLNIDEDYFCGVINLPIPKYNEETDRQINDFKNKTYLFRYISDCMNYDIDVLQENQEPLIWQLEKDVNAFLITRLEELGINKKG